MVIRFAHTNIVSTDWESLVAFYIATFQCEVVPPIRKQSGTWLEEGTGLVNAQLQGAHLRLPGYGEKGPTLEIYQYAETVAQEVIAPNTRGFGHIAFEVDNVPEILAKVLENGGSVNGKITTREVIGVGQLSFVYARDPEGNLIELQSWN